MAIVTASLTVSFGSRTDGGADTGDGSGVMVLEVDGRPDGLNGGRTSFFRGDEVYLLLYTGPSVTVRAVQSTAGDIRRSGSGQRSIDQTLTLSGSDSASLSHPSAGISSRAWIGSGLALPGLTPAPAATVDGPTRLVWPVQVVGLYRVQYVAGYTAYRLAGVPEDQAIVFVVGEVPD